VQNPAPHSAKRSLPSLSSAWPCRHPQARAGGGRRQGTGRPRCVANQGTPSLRQFRPDLPASWIGCHGSLSLTLCGNSAALFGATERHRRGGHVSVTQRRRRGPPYSAIRNKSAPQAAAGTGSASDVLGACWRLGAPGPIIGRPNVAVAIAAHTPRPAFPDHARAGYPA
jgi:hypothetical protein